MYFRLNDVGTLVLLAVVVVVAVVVAIAIPPGPAYQSTCQTSLSPRPHDRQ